MTTLTRDRSTSTVQYFPIPESNITSDAVAKAVCLSDVDQKLNEFARYPEDWDGQGGVPPSRETIETARKCLQGLFVPKGLPDVDLNNDGTISFSWTRDTVRWYWEIEGNVCRKSGIDLQKNVSDTRAIKI
jgi:hypothetical protein